MSPAFVYKIAGVIINRPLFCIKKVGAIIDRPQINVNYIIVNRAYLPEVRERYCPLCKFRDALSYSFRLLPFS